jgi:hypothetical protein
MFPENAIDQFILNLRLQAIIEGIDEQAALSYAAARLRLATGEIAKYEYHILVDEIERAWNISPESGTDKSLKLSHWIEQQLGELDLKSTQC